MPPLPPKPTIGPLVRRTLFAAALGAGACGPSKPQPIRIGAYEPRIGAHEVPPHVYEPDAAVPMAADAGSVPVPDPIRIGPPPPPPPRIGPPERIGPPDDLFRSSLIRGEIHDDQGQPLARTSLRVSLSSGARIVATDVTGSFLIDGLPPGEYAAVVEIGGYAPMSATLTSTRKPVVARLIARR